MNALTINQTESKAVGQSVENCPEIIDRVIPYIIDHFAEDITLNDLADEAGMSRFSFCRRFQKECATSPMRWLWTFRALLAAEFIKLDPNWSLTDVAFACGFTSSAHFSRFFKQTIGESPSAFRSAERVKAIGTKTQPVGFDALYSNQGNLINKAAVKALAFS